MSETLEISCVIDVNLKTFALKHAGSNFTSIVKQDGDEWVEPTADDLWGLLVGLMIRSQGK